MPLYARGGSTWENADTSVNARVVVGSSENNDSPTASNVVSTLSASSITSSGATLNGELHSLEGAADATVQFQYRFAGEEPTQKTATQTVTATGTFDDSVSGLQADTTYDYWALATVNGVTYAGDVQTFTTPT